jgi:hypothetical protein
MDNTTQPSPRCAAYDCAEPIQTSTSVYCVAHQREVLTFHQWLDGWDNDGYAIPRSFEASRLAWETGEYKNAPR